MMVVEQELVLDLTEEKDDYKMVLEKAIETVLNSEILEFTLVSHLSRRFWVTDLTQILQQTNNLEVLSLFSIALTGSPSEFEELGKALRRHRELKEVHMVDCGMLGNWDKPESATSASHNGEDGSNATSANTASVKSITSKSLAKRTKSNKEREPKDVDSKPKADKTPPSNSGPATSKEAGSVAQSDAPTDTTALSASKGASVAQSDAPTDAAVASKAAAASSSSSVAQSDGATNKKGRASTGAASVSKTITSSASNSAAPSTVASSKGQASTIASSKGQASTVASSKGPPPSLDVILNALSTIPTLENVEIYGIPTEKFDKSSDGDQESGHQAIQEEGEADQDIPMVPMGEKDSLNFSDNDFMADYDEDIRGIPGHGQVACSISKKLSMMMSPKALGNLCVGCHITNLGLEDVNFSHKHVELLADAFSREGNKINELKLYGCSIDDRGAIAISRMLKTNKTLERLDLSYNKIGDEGCVAIAVALQGNKILKYLNLMGNACAETYDLATEGGCYEALLELLEKNKTLKDLILEPFEQDDASDCVPEFIIIPNNKSPDDISSASDED